MVHAATYFAAHLRKAIKIQMTTSLHAMMNSNHPQLDRITLKQVAQDKHGTFPYWRDIALKQCSFGIA